MIARRGAELPEMVYVDFPVGSMHGWGVCGKYCTRELARLTPARLLADQLSPESVGDAFDWHELAGLQFPSERLKDFPQRQGVTNLDGPLLAPITGKEMTPLHSHLRGTRTVGYTFFEDNIIVPAWIENAARHFDWVATGSSWCTQILKDGGLQRVSTVLQGVDHRLFFPQPGEREFFRDMFVVFSGGKLEFRKGQDIAMRAYKVLQDRHEDVMLVNSWYNPWTDSLETMRMSKLIRFNPPEGPYIERISAVLEENGIDTQRVIVLPPQPNSAMRRIYVNSDIGLFPNRCEGGTNLVLMEYMACGKPVVASNMTGHADLVTRANALVIEARGTTELRAHGGEAVARWPEPDLDQAIEQLETAYQRRDDLRALGERAAADLSPWNWARTAAQFLELLCDRR